MNWQLIHKVQPKVDENFWLYSSLMGTPTRFQYRLGLEELWPSDSIWLPAPDENDRPVPKGSRLPWPKKAARRSNWEKLTRMVLFIGPLGDEKTVVVTWEGRDAKTVEETANLFVAALNERKYP